MISKLFYLCPACKTEDSLTISRNHIHCQACSQAYEFYNDLINYNNKSYSVSAFYELVRDQLPVDWIRSAKLPYISGKAVLRQGIKKIRYRGFSGEKTDIEVPLEIDKGQFYLESAKAVFKGDKADYTFLKSDLTSFSTNSNYFEFKLKGQPFFQIQFEQESPLKYEDLFSLWFNYSQEGNLPLEHQPKIIFKQPQSIPLLLNRLQIEQPEFREKFSFLEYILHLLIGKSIVFYLRKKNGLTFENAELVPAHGPFILIMNHESYLDPILISTLLPRRIGFFTKSTSFSQKILQMVFRAYRTLPTRRYEIDPHVIRRALKRLKSGHAVGVFPEGERTWDGRLLPFKYNTIRFLMSAQVPIVMVKISGAYKVLPRWSHALQPGTIKIVTERCLSLIPGCWQTEDLKKELEKFYLQN